MVWFKVDDNLHSNRKIRKVLADDPAALALWVVAGSWCADETTDGFVPDDQLPWLYPAGAEQLAQKLVAARLWTRVRGGFQFHQWLNDGDGSKRNPSREEVENERRKKAEAGRKGGLASGKTRSTKEARASAPAKHVLGDSLNPRPDPTRPSPSKEGERASAHTEQADTGDEEPPTRCDKHLNDPDPPPCGGCADARKRHQRWQTQHDAQAEQTRRQEAAARSAEARNRAEAARSAIDACDRCDDTGHIQGRPCTHEDPRLLARRASQGASRAAANITALAKERAAAVAAARSTGNGLAALDDALTPQEGQQ